MECAKSFGEKRCDENANVNTINASFIRMVHMYSALNYRAFSKLGIHPGQLPVLKIVSEQEGISLRELASLLHIKPPTVTVTVQRLEKAGMVRRETDLSDQRINRIYLTEKGAAMKKEMIRLLDENEKILTKGFSKEEIRTLQSFFAKMTENLIQAGADAEEEKQLR